jgi:signal transduction histidine kinase
MIQNKRLSNLFPKIALALLALIGLYLASLYSYLLFHTLAELFSILIGGTIFVLSWNFRRFFEDSFLVFIGTASLFFSFIDLMHTLTYQGMNIIPGVTTNVPTQLWIAARYLQSISLLLAPFFIGRKVRGEWLAAAFGLVTTLLLLAIFVEGIFPVCYIEGVGLTPFKIISEYVIDVLLVGALALLLQKRTLLRNDVLWLLSLSIVTTMVGEIFFTFYIDVYGLMNLVGHFCKIIASFLIYKAIVGTAAASIYTDMTVLKQTELALRESEAREKARVVELEALMDAVPAAVLISTDRECRTLTGNAAAYELFRMPFGSNQSMTAPENQAPKHFRIFKDGKELNPEELPVQIAASTGIEIHDFEEEIVFDTGEIRYLIGNVTPLIDFDQQAKGAIGAFTDISELKQAQADLKKYASQLERSNQDLEEFAYVASHDLREPLRKIQAFGDRLKRQLAGKLELDEIDSLERMISASQRMQSMIESLLAYSRVTTHPHKFEKVELSRIIRDVLSDLELRIEETGGQVIVPDLPAIEADPLQIRLLFQNIIGNALKFHQPDIPPIVKMLCFDEKPNRISLNRQIRIEITDNGIGFEIQYLERIFRPFERLHGKSEYEGTGIGLAICRKIVERHGGTISAQSVPGEGSTFIVRLPVKQRVND